MTSIKLEDSRHVHISITYALVSMCVPANIFSSKVKITRYILCVMHYILGSFANPRYDCSSFHLRIDYIERSFSILLRFGKVLFVFHLISSSVLITEIERQQTSHGSIHTFKRDELDVRIQKTTLSHAR